MKLLIFVAALFTAALFTISAEYSHDSYDVQITKDINTQYDPAIYQDIVVWADFRNSNYDIYGYNVKTKQEFQITTNKNDQQAPAIYEDIVVWEDERNGNLDIYGYNLETKQEFQITTDPHNQLNPAIYSTMVVWTDRRNGNLDIYGYNLETGEEFQITTDPEEQRDAALYEDIVVWEDERNNNIDTIYGYNLKTGEEFQVHKKQLFPSRGGQYSPAIYENIVLWTESSEDIIYGYNLETSKKVKIAAAQKNSCNGAVCRACNPAIYNNIVVWADFRNSNYDIYGYNLETHQEFQITTDEHDQYRPAIYDSMVVWTDRRNGKSDIYGIDLPSCAMIQATAQRTRLFLNWFIYATLVAIFTIFAAIRAGKSPLNIKLQGETENFGRNTKFCIFIVVSALFIFLSGFFIFYWWPHHFPAGFMWSLLYGLLIYFALWQKRTPYIVKNDDKIVILKGLSTKETITWSTIKCITIQKRNIKIVFPNGSKTKIRLYFVNEKDKKDLIQAFKHFSPCDT